MNRFAYDTLGTSKKLEAAGMERYQAEAVATAIAQREGNLATKSDIDGVKSDIDGVKSDIDGVKSEIRSLRAEVKSDINGMKSEINLLRTEVTSEMKAQFRWLMTMQVIVILAIIALAYQNGS